MGRLIPKGYTIFNMLLKKAIGQKFSNHKSKNSQKSKCYIPGRKHFKCVPNQGHACYAFF